jgi:hypothetical protein
MSFCCDLQIHLPSSKSSASPNCLFVVPTESLPNTRSFLALVLRPDSIPTAEPDVKAKTSILL